MLDILMIILFFLLIILLWIMMYDGTRFVIRNYMLRNNKIRRSYRAVVLADLHNKQYGKKNELLLEAIDSQKPDVIWIVGDMLIAKPHKSLQPAIDIVTALAEKYPIFYANGNHEQRLKLYPEKYGEMATEYEQALEKLGVHPLVNENRRMKDENTVIYGLELEKYYYKRFVVPKMEEDYLKETLGEPEKDSYTILLAHNPDYFPVYCKWGADLILSGHVHGGMVRIPGWRGLLSPNVRFFPKYDGGKFEEGDSTMILSRGLGMHTIPIRLFNPGELIVLDFKADDNYDTGK